MVGCKAGEEAVQGSRQGRGPAEGETRQGRRQGRGDSRAREMARQR
jgi:hypothetical protein